jgi:type II secretory ATPase GspE/PulE/Tfp pilus assembly ATPase PilB-like protein
LVLGEIRDDETANLAVRAGLTGHLVISTLHAGSCREVYERLALMCADRFAAASVTGLILNQRLVRCRCRACAGNGCADCLDTGYRGRAPLVEWVRVDEPTRDRLRAQGVSALVPATTLAEAAAELVERGVTDGAEIQRVLG